MNTHKCTVTTMSVTTQMTHTQSMTLYNVKF